MKDFLASAKPDTTELDEETAISFAHWGTPVKFYEPTDGQALMMLSLGGRNMAKDAAGTFVHLFVELGDPETQQYLREMLLTRGSGFGLMTPGGIFDIWEGLMEEWSGKDSENASDSPTRPSKTGRASTASTRVGASSSSRSRSRVSST